MTGFKSFAQKTELIFGNTINLVLGANGNGKCVTGDTLVQLTDRVVPIKTLFDEKESQTQTQQLDDGFLILGDNTKVPCLDTETGSTVLQPIKAYIKRTAPSHLFKITTRSGRRITATPYHPLFVLKESSIVSVRADELTEGTKIAVPRKVNFKPTTKIFYELLNEVQEHDGIFVPWSEELYKRVKAQKSGTWQLMAQNAQIPLIALKGFLDRQAMNMTYVIRLLRSFKMSDDEMISLIPLIKSKTGSKTYPMLWKNSKELARFLGYLLAEGRLSTTSSQIWFTNGTEEVVEDYLNLVKQLFNEKPLCKEYKPNCWDVIIYSEPLKKVLSKFGMAITGKTIDKKVASFFFTHSADEECAELLNGLYCGDGYVSKQVIEITTKSPQLCSSIQYALTRLGIIFQTREVIKIATNSGFCGKYLSISIYGSHAKDFAEQIHLVHNMKRERSMLLGNKKTNSNLDLIDVNPLIKKVVRQLNINVKRTKKTFPILDSYYYNQCTPSRRGIQTLVTEVFSPTLIQTAELQKLVQLSESNIYWDEIVSVEESDHTEQWVYDLCVDRHHNFIANNIFVHNSNVLDAICFVLGRTSSKSLRAEKTSHLIYDGGKTKKPAEKGQVDIHFDNATGIFPIDAVEVKVSRIIKRNGQSIYKINDKTHTRSEVLDLLSAARIDPDGYNIILQGDITRFVEMSPLERRQIIEEISGISVYEEKKHKAVLELDKVEKQLNEAEIILKERQTHLRELKKDRDQALKFKELKDNIDSNKATFVHLQIEKRSETKTSFDKKCNELKEEFDTVEKKIAEHKKDIEDKKKEIEKIAHDIEQKGEVEQVKLSKQVEQMRIELEKQKARVVMIKDALTKAKQRMHALDKDMQDIEKNADDLRRKKTELDAMKADKEKELQSIEKKIDEFKKKNKIDTLGDVEREIETVDKAIETKQEKTQQIRQQQQELLREKDKVEYQLKTLDDRMKKVSQIEKENQQQLSELKKKKEDFKRVTLQLNTCLDKDSTLSRDVGSYRKELMALEEEKAKLAGRHLSAQERVGGDIAVKKILELKKKKAGIYGTIAELGKVSKQYQLALEIAAGNRLTSIVVESDTVAASCISYLRENKFGVATFIPLNTVRSSTSSATDALLKKKGVHNKCIELVQFDRKFEKAFAHVFGDTVVVDNLDVARDIGIGKARMVTLQGDLADMSGVMRGGFHHRKAASFTESDTEEELMQAESKLGSLRITIDKLTKEKDSNEQLILKLRREKMELEGDVARMEKTLHLAGDDIDATTQERKQLQQALDETDNKLREIQTNVTQHTKELALDKTKKEQLKLKITTMRNPRLLAELTAFDEARQNMKDELLKMSSDAHALNTQITTMMKPEQERILQLIKGHEKEETAFTKELGELESKIKGDQEQLKEKEKVQREFFSAYKDLFQQRDKIAEHVNSVEKKMETMRELSRKTEIEMNTLTLKRAAVASELSGFEEQMKQLGNAKILKSKNEEELKIEIAKFEKMLTSMSVVNMKALEIYEQVETEYNKLVEKKETLLKEKGDVVTLMEEIEGKKKEQFMKTFDAINTRFADKFSALTTKGKGFLHLENAEKPFDGGMDIHIKVAGQRFMDIRSLSGGEKTMTALAFYFAVQEYEPHSFYVMDEVDAALDKHNSERLAQLIRQYCKNAQYIVISHNDALISESDQLYGVSMNEDGASKVVSLKV